MKICGLSWGYDGGGIACGPVPGADIVELICEDADGTRYYISTSLFEQFEHMNVSRRPLFGLLMAQWIEEILDMDTDVVPVSLDFEICHGFTEDQAEREMAGTRFAS